MCTSPLVRYRLKKGVVSDTIFGNSTSFSIKSQRYLEELFGSYSAFRLYFDSNCDYQIIKCRKCNECRIEYATDWAVRCANEYQIINKGCFITLTIDDTKVRDFMNNKKLQNTYCKRCVKGSRYYKYPINYSLNKGFILDELKRMRDVLYKRYGISIRYFGVGEYGADDRPHYHMLLFGYDFPDRFFHSYSKKGFPIYYSHELNELWGYGITTIQDINIKTCLYTAKYCLKKVRTNNDITLEEVYYGREPEFLFMSKGNCKANSCPFIDEIIKNCKGMKSLRSLDNPYCKFCDKTRGGIGFSYWQRYYKNLIQLGYINIDGVKYSIPKYYIEILKLTDSEMYDKYKLNKLSFIDTLDEKDRSQNKLDIRSKIIKDKLKHSTRL